MPRWRCCGWYPRQTPPGWIISANDSAYLELALRTGLPLATLDTDLTKAATTAGVAIFDAL